jgi:hypothetical protein
MVSKRRGRRNEDRVICQSSLLGENGGGGIKWVPVEDILGGDMTGCDFILSFFFFSFPSNITNTGDMGGLSFLAFKEV